MYPSSHEPFDFQFLLPFGCDDSFFAMSIGDVYHFFPFLPFSCNAVGFLFLYPTAIRDGKYRNHALRFFLMYLPVPSYVPPTVGLGRANELGCLMMIIHGIIFVLFLFSRSLRQDVM